MFLCQFNHLMLTWLDPPLPRFDSFNTYDSKDEYSGYPPAPVPYTLPYGAGAGGMYDPDAYSR